MYRQLNEQRQLIYKQPCASHYYPYTRKKNFERANPPDMVCQFVAYLHWCTLWLMHNLQKMSNTSRFNLCAPIFDVYWKACCILAYWLFSFLYPIILHLQAIHTSLLSFCQISFDTLMTWWAHLMWCVDLTHRLAKDKQAPKE